MFIRKYVFLLAALFSLTLGSAAFAQTVFQLGAVLNQAQISALGNMTSFTVNNARFRILPSSSATGGNVVNDQGRIGRCEGDVLIAGIPTSQAKASLATYQASIVSVQVYDSLQMVSARFSNLVDAANARNALSGMLPNARVTLPIIFSLPQSR
jgi:hypothetical protein